MHAGQATELWLPRFNRFDGLPGIFHFHDLLTYTQHSIHHGMELRCIPYTLPSLCKEVRVTRIRFSFPRFIHSYLLLRIHHMLHALLRATTSTGEKELTF